MAVETGHTLIESLAVLIAAGEGPLTQTGTTSPSPLFLAEVDAVDTTAVLALLAAIPTNNGQGLRVFERRNGGWMEVPKYVQQFNSVDPPTVVELDRETLLQVVQQLDESDLGDKKGQESAEPPPVAAAESDEAPPEPFG